MKIYWYVAFWRDRPSLCKTIHSSTKVLRGSRSSTLGVIDILDSRHLLPTLDTPSVILKRNIDKNIAIFHHLLCLFVSTQYTNVTDTRRADGHRTTTQVARLQPGHHSRAAKIIRAQIFVILNPLIATLKPQSNRPSYIAIQRLVHWPLMSAGLQGCYISRGGDWSGPQPAQALPRCTKCRSPPINDQCTNIVLFDVAL